MRTVLNVNGTSLAPNEPMSVLLLGLWELAASIERQPPDQVVVPHVMALVQECESLLNHVEASSPDQ